MMTRQNHGCQCLSGRLRHGTSGYGVSRTPCGDSCVERRWAILTITETGLRIHSRRLQTPEAPRVPHQATLVRDWAFSSFRRLRLSSTTAINPLSYKFCPLRGRAQPVHPCDVRGFKRRNTSNCILPGDVSARHNSFLSYSGR